MKRLRHFAAAAAALLAACAFTASHGCTTFGLARDGRSLFGQNYDWMVADGLVLVNKRGLAKGCVETGTGPTWVSKYGSVTFNQYGRELPVGGMNERGLAFGIMWLEESKYEAPDDRKALGLLQWAQYQIDNHATVAEVVANVRAVRIAQGASSARVHYHFSDAEGQSAIIEVLDGKLVVHSGLEIPTRTLSNDTYASCAETMKRFEGFGGGAPVPTDRGSVSRFVRAASATAGKAVRPTVGGAFSILDDVAQGDFTKWSIVYDSTDRTISFRTHNAPEVKTIDFAKIDFGCDTPTLALDIDTPDAGDVTARFTPCTTETNAALIERAIAATPFLKGKVPEQLQKMLAAAPERFACVKGDSE